MNPLALALIARLPCQSGKPTMLTAMAAALVTSGQRARADSARVAALARGPAVATGRAASEYPSGGRASTRGDRGGRGRGRGLPSLRHAVRQPESASAPCRWFNTSPFYREPSA